MFQTKLYHGGELVLIVADSRYTEDLRDTLDRGVRVLPMTNPEWEDHRDLYRAEHDYGVCGCPTCRCLCLTFEGVKRLRIIIDEPIRRYARV